MDDLNVNPNPKRGVSWGAVLGGIVLALVAGIVVVPGAMIAGGFLAEEAKKAGNLAIAAGTLIALLLAGCAYWGMWTLSRRRSADLAIGIIIGGAMMTLLSGGCGLLLSGVAVGGVH